MACDTLDTWLENVAQVRSVKTWFLFGGWGAFALVKTVYPLGDFKVSISVEAHIVCYTIAPSTLKSCFAPRVDFSEALKIYCTTGLPEGGRG